MADIAGAVRCKAVVEMGIFLFHISQYIFCLVGGSIIDDNDFKLRVILFQDSRKDFTQIVSFVARTDDDGSAGRFFYLRYSVYVSGYRCPDNRITESREELRLLIVESVRKY